MRAWTDDDASVLLQVRMAALAGAPTPLLCPLEALWGLASPVAAPSVEAAAAALAAALVEQREARVALVLGIDRDSGAFDVTAMRLQATHRLHPVPDAVRSVASLDAGFDGYLSRRTRKFRAGLRRDIAVGDSAGLRFQRVRLTPDTLPEVLQRLERVERHSWKTRAEAGILEEPMWTFVRGVLARCAALGIGAAVFAARDGHDVGYLTGALAEKRFRGLQMSFDDALRSIGVGNLLQWAALQWAIELGADSYDLGSSMPYKARWAESSHTTAGFFAIAR